MAFLKYAKATVQKPGIKFAEWDALRRTALSPAPDFQKRTAKVILEEYDPAKYMLSHATIVASVNVDNAQAPLGRHYVDGFEVDRQYPDYYVTADTSQYINNNNDAFERKLLLASFKTFIGAHSYVEHVQIPELAKGRIIDAAARDVGDSVYIDILIANDIKHADLIRAIKSGQLGTLSMGCFTPGAQVTMFDGTRLPIEEVAVGDIVMSHTGNQREVTAKQIKVGRFGMKRLDVVGVPSPIEATNIHPFFVLRAPELCACGCGERLTYSPTENVQRRVSKRFRIGHQMRVFNPNGPYSLAEARERRTRLSQIHTRQELVEVQADQLQVGDLLCFPKSQVAEVGGGTPGKARLLGYFLAEGSFLKRKGVPTEVQFNFSMAEKSTFVAEVASLIRQEFPEAGNPWIQERVDRDTCVVHATGKDMVQWFHAHGGEYSDRKCLSAEVMGWSKDLQIQLIGTWLNGDGTIRSDLASGASGTTTSYSLACQLHMLFMRCGLFARMYCSFDGHSCAVQEAVNGGRSLRGLSNGRLAAFTLNTNQRGSKALEFATTKMSAGVGENSPWRESETHVFFPVRSIESFQYEGPVYDMTVEEDHSYIVEGVAVHNCSTSSTTCTKCGNVAKDETQLCACIRFFKGSEFFDEFGTKRKVAELCGHYTDPNSVKFIEASWVANPAFKGAVIRNILTAKELKGVEDKMHLAFTIPTPAADPNAMRKAARMLFSQQEAPAQAPAQELPADPATDAAPPGEQADPMQKTVDDLAKALRDQAIEKVRKEMNEGEAGKVKEVVDENKQNESLIRSAMKSPEWRRVAKFVISFVGKSQARKVLIGLIHHKGGGWKQVRNAGFTGTDMLALSRVIDVMTQKTSMAGETRVYRTVLSVGGTAPYGDAETYLAACRQVLGRVVTGSEAAKLLEKGRLYALGRS